MAELNVSEIEEEEERNEALLELVRSKKFRTLRQVLSEMNEVDVAAFIEELDPVIENHVKALGIEALPGQNAKNLSGGETARMALCRILMRPYDLLILDEPTTAMDMESTLAAEKLICETSREQGCALVLITHSISQARRIADCVIVLHQGRLIEQGESIQVLSKPKQEKTKRFLEFYGL